MNLPVKCKLIYDEGIHLKSIIKTGNRKERERKYERKKSPQAKC